MQNSSRVKKVYALGFRYGSECYDWKQRKLQYFVICKQKHEFIATEA